MVPKICMTPHFGPRDLKSIEAVLEIVHHQSFWSFSENYVKQGSKWQNYPQFNKQAKMIWQSLRVFLSFYSYYMDIFHRMTKMIDCGQTQGSILSISNLKDQSKELCKSQGPFWRKSLKGTAQVQVQLDYMTYPTISSSTRLYDIPLRFKFNYMTYPPTGLYINNFMSCEAIASRFSPRWGYPQNALASPLPFKTFVCTSHTGLGHGWSCKYFNWIFAGKVFSDLVNSMDQSGAKYGVLYVSDPSKSIQYPSHRELERFLAESGSGNASANSTACDEVCLDKIISSRGTSSCKYPFPHLLFCYTMVRYL